MKNRAKRIPVAPLLVLIALVAVVWVGQSRPDGSTMESRQEILSEQVKNKSTIEIVHERHLDAHIISAYTRSNGQHGLAVFESRGKGKYRLKTGVNRLQGELVIGHIILDEIPYNLFWADEENLDYAQITYTVGGKAGDPIRLDASGDPILLHEAPLEDYIVETVFFDRQGNRYE